MVKALERTNTWETHSSRYTYQLWMCAVQQWVRLIANPNWSHRTDLLYRSHEESERFRSAVLRTSFLGFRAHPDSRKLFRSP